LAFKFGIVVIDVADVDVEVFATIRLIAAESIVDIEKANEVINVLILKQKVRALKRGTMCKVGKKLELQIYW
jgi:hypothetical protein